MTVSVSNAIKQFLYFSVSIHSRRSVKRVYSTEPKTTTGE